MTERQAGRLREIGRERHTHRKVGGREREKGSEESLCLIFMFFCVQLYLSLISLPLFSSNYSLP